MLMERIIKAFTFKREVYAEVEKDTSFTPMAWGIVVIVSLLNQISGYLVGQAGATAAAGIVGGSAAAVAFSPVNILIGTAVQIAGFALGAFLISYIAKAMFKAEATFDEVVRTVGLAYVWGSIGIVGGLLAFIAPLLVCIASPLLIAAAVLSLVAWVVAVHEALDLEWGNTAIVVVIAFVVNMVISGVLLGIFGISNALMGAF